MLMSPAFPEREIEEVADEMGLDYFIGVGEGIDDLRPFEPAAFADRLAGAGWHATYQDDDASVFVVDGRRPG